jgi:hypothetical protein
MQCSIVADFNLNLLICGYHADDDNKIKKDPIVKGRRKHQKIRGHRLSGALLDIEKGT